ncbi:dTDP-glucose 4,6-dehydratase [Klebsiella pneumoniae subsp. rhinoscleromatis]|nr:dTDP-glucose 4,6-dehydratase [Klebsiella pneumoniae subsp. rhinoscleromatis]
MLSESTNMNDYYDVSLKQARLDRLASPAFHFQQLDLADREGYGKAVRHRAI